MYKSEFVYNLASMNPRQFNAFMCVLSFSNLCHSYSQVSVTGNMRLADNSSVDLFEPNWTPLVLTSASVIHFLLSALLIVSYCYLKVRHTQSVF